MSDTTAVIVALPPVLDPIRLVGDEEKHATLLSFGETASLPDEAKTNMLESLATVAGMFKPFSEEVIGVERLGNEVPPALVAKLSNRFLDRIRDSFQINPSIVEYMSNGTQYPSFTPHVTLAHPDYQGEADLRKLIGTLYEMRFDRLALWWNDERFEFKLGFDGGVDGPKQLRMAMEVDEFLAHMGVARGTLEADSLADEFLAHYGKKGMKWGVRRSLQKMDSSARAGYVAAKDAKWTAKVQNNPKLAKVSRLAARQAKKLTKKLKADYKTQGKNIKKNPLDRARYDAELKQILDHSLDRASYKVHKFSKTRLSEVQIHRHPDGSIMATIAPRQNAKIVKQRGKIAKTDARTTKALAREEKKKGVRALDDKSDVLNQLSHAEDDVTEEDYFGLEFYMPVDEEGYVTDVQTPFGDEGDVEHAIDLVDNFLEHVGVKGMKWGVRRSQKALDKSAGRKPDTDNAGHDRSAKKSMDKMKPGSVVPMQNADGTTKLLLKKKDGTWKETYISADAEKFLHSTSKEGHELSDRELKETAARARLVKDYDGFFGDKPNAELQAKVEAMRLQSEYKKYDRELNPPRPSIVSRFTTGATKAYTAYTVLDKASGGELSSKVNANIAKAFAQSSAASKMPSVPKAPKIKKQKGPKFSGKNAYGSMGKTPPAPWANASAATFKPNPAYTPGGKTSSSSPLYDITDLGKAYKPATDYPNPFAPALNSGK